MRSLPVATGFNYSDLNNLAVFQYTGAPLAYPTLDPTVYIPVSKTPLVETNLHVSLLYELLRTRLTFSCAQPLVPSPVVRIIPENCTAQPETCY